MNEKGQPLTSASVRIQGQEHELPVSSTAHYYKILPTGDYTVSAVAPGRNKHNVVLFIGKMENNKLVHYQEHMDFFKNMR